MRYKYEEYFFLGISKYDDFASGFFFPEFSSCEKELGLNQDVHQKLKSNFC